MENTNLPLDGGRKLTFTGPSGYSYTIREQNGADDDILSNPEEAKTLMNLARFVAGIIIETDADKSKKLTTAKAYELPILDIYTIILKSRIHSIGENLDFNYDWGNGQKLEYSQDLRDFLFKDYSLVPEEEELDQKTNAIPYYIKVEDEIVITTTSGKELSFRLNTLKSESYKINLPLSRQTKNQDLIARNLSLKLDGKFQPIKDFSFLSKKDLAEIRSQVNKYDPVFTGNTTITNTATGDVATVSIFGIDDFFFPGEI